LARADANAEKVRALVHGKLEQASDLQLKISVRTIGKGRELFFASRSWLSFTEHPLLRSTLS